MEQKAVERAKQAGIEADDILAAADMRVAAAVDDAVRSIEDNMAEFVADAHIQANNIVQNAATQANSITAAAEAKMAAAEAKMAEAESAFARFFSNFKQNMLSMSAEQAQAALQMDLSNA